MPTGRWHPRSLLRQTGVPKRGVRSTRRPHRPERGPDARARPSSHDRPHVLHGAPDDAGSTASHMEPQDPAPNRRVLLRPPGSCQGLHAEPVLAVGRDVIQSEYLRESATRVMALTDDQARALATLGKRLASKKAWWGDDAELEEESERTVIRVEPYGVGRWSVRVNDAIGVIALGDLQLIVHPKIPTAHVLYLFARSGEFPRLEELDKGAASAAPDLWSLVASWFTTAMEHLLRQGLVRDYLELIDELPAIRGRLEPIPTASLYYAGRLAVACE